MCQFSSPCSVCYFLGCCYFVSWSMILAGDSDGSLSSLDLSFLVISYSLWSLPDHHTSHRCNIWSFARWQFLWCHLRTGTSWRVIGWSLRNNIRSSDANLPTKSSSLTIACITLGDFTNMTTAFYQLVQVFTNWEHHWGVPLPPISPSLSPNLTHWS